MAVSTTSEKLSANNAVEMYDFDPGATTAVDVAWVDMRDFETFMALAMRTIGTGAVTFTILANSASDGSGTDVEIKAHAVGSEPDATGDYLVLECTAEEIRQAGADLRYVSAAISVATATDEMAVTYIRGGARNPSTGLTADSVA